MGRLSKEGVGIREGVGELGVGMGILEGVVWGMWGMGLDMVVGVYMGIWAWVWVVMETPVPV